MKRREIEGAEEGGGKEREMWCSCSDPKRRRKEGSRRKSRERGGSLEQKEGRADYFRVASVDRSAGTGRAPELAHGRRVATDNLTISRAVQSRVAAYS